MLQLIILAETLSGFKNGLLDFFVRGLTTELFVTSINESGNFKNACRFFTFQTPKVVYFRVFRAPEFSPKKSAEKFL
jgi:hypothetical protein